MKRAKRGEKEMAYLARSTASEKRWLKAFCGEFGRSDRKEFGVGSGCGVMIGICVFGMGGGGWGLVQDKRDKNNNVDACAFKVVDGYERCFITRYMKCQKIPGLFSQAR